MTTQTSYRIRMRTRHVDDIAGAMRPISELNTTEAREARLSWWDTPALFGRMRTFGPHIHQQQPEGPGFWSWRDGELILAFDAVGMERVDGRPVGTHGRSIIFDVLSSLCDEPEGTIVGGIQYEHSCDWRLSGLSG